MVLLFLKLIYPAIFQLGISKIDEIDAFQSSDRIIAGKNLTLIGLIDLWNYLASLLKRGSLVRNQRHRGG